MQLQGPCRYRLTLTQDPPQFSVLCPNGTPRFSGLGSTKLPKLYVVLGDVDGRAWPVYVGITSQRMAQRFRYGWDADGRTGYHGYKWRHILKHAAVDVWAAEAQGEQVVRDLETIEAELVFLIRQHGQWPLHQTEIHFHPSEERHRRAAAAVFGRYLASTGSVAELATPATPTLTSAPKRPNKRGTTSPDFENPNNQKNIRALGIPGTDHGQSLYEMLCLRCGHQYAANGSDIHSRKCPACQKGAPSSGGWKPR